MSERFGMGPADVVVSGSGSPLLLIHGWPFHRENYRKIIPLLRSSFTCIAVNLQGLNGRACPSDVDLSFEAHAERLSSYLRREGIDRVSVLGHNTGGTIARMLAAQSPSLVEHLVLLNTEIPNHRPPFIPFYQRVSKLPGNYAVFKRLMASQTWRHSAAGFGGCFFDKSMIDGEFTELFGTYWTDDPVRYRGLMRYLQAIDFSLVDRLQEIHDQISAPVTCIWGEDDPTFPIELGREMAENVPTLSAFHHVPQTKFLPHEERPEIVASLLKQII